MEASPGHEPRSPSRRNCGLEYPAVSSFQKDGAIVVRAGLPGVTAGDVEVEVADGKLLIKGEMKKLA